MTPTGTAVDAAGAVTDTDGVAHYSGPADYELAYALTSATAPQTISYVARTQVLGSNPSTSVAPPPRRSDTVYTTRNCRGFGSRR
jgi:hypothetical protein